MAVTDSKFSNFADGGDLSINDIVVGLRGGVNTRFNFQGVPNTYLPLAGGTMLGAIDMNSNAITTLPAPTNGGDATNKTYVDAAIASAVAGYLPLSGGTMSGVIDMGSHKITNLTDPTSAQDAATKAYVDSTGSGTVSPGLINQLAWYSASGTTVSGLATLASGLLVTSAGGVPSIATDIPTAVTIGGAYIYRVGGTKVAVTDGGSGVGTLTGLLTGNGTSNFTGTAITQYNILSGGASNLPNSIAPSATSGVPLISQGAASQPIFGTALVPGGGTGLTSATAYALICGGTTSTGAFQSVSGLGTLNQVLISQGAGALPIWGSVPGVTPAALTKTDDTNVTMTLGGTPSTALLQATSMTLGWTGQLAVGRGGTGLSAITAHYLPIGNGTSALTLLAPSATSGVPLISQGAAADPAYGTAVVAGGGTGNTTFTAYSVLCAGTTATGAFQNVSGVGTAGQVLQSNGAGALPSWATIPGATSAALTATSDTNVTLTLGGAPTTALLTAASVTAGWSGQLSLARGGSNANLTASNGGIVYSTASAMAILSGTATAGQMLQSGASGAPSWSTSTYPATNAVNTLLYASSANVMSALPTANSSVLVTSAGGVPSLSTTLPNIAIGTPTSGSLPNCTGYTVANLDDVAWTNFTPTVTGMSSTSLTNGRYKKIGKTVFISLEVAGTSNAATFTITNLPYPLTASVNTSIFFCLGLGIDAGSNQFPTLGSMDASGTTLTLYKNTSITNQSASAWTNSGGKAIYSYLFYQTDS